MKKIICTLLTTLLILSLLVTPACATSQSNTQDAVLHFDATAIGLHLSSLYELSEEEQLLSDIDFDSKVSILDATKIQRKLADYIFY